LLEHNIQEHQEITRNTNSLNMTLLLNYHRKQEYKGKNDSFHTGLIPVTITLKHFLQTQG